MKKIGLILPLIIASGVAYARITGVNPTGASADVWCHGPKGKEVCQDASGDLLPTTNNVGSLGTSSLNWNDLRVNTIEAAGLITGSAPISLSVQTTSQLLLRSDSAGTLSLAQESPASATPEYLLCVSTGAAASSYVYTSSAAITVGPNIGVVVGAGQGCIK